MNNGSSASISSGSHLLLALLICSCHHRSLPSVIATSTPVLLTTKTLLIDGVSNNALSALAFIGILSFVPLTPVSCVMRILHDESFILSLSESALNAPKTTECTAPILQHASMAIASSGIICIYRQTLSPFITPLDLRTFANFFTSISNSE